MGTLSAKVEITWSLFLTNSLSKESTASSITGGFFFTVSISYTFFSNVLTAIILYEFLDTSCRGGEGREKEGRKGKRENIRNRGKKPLGRRRKKTNIIFVIGVFNSEQEGASFIGPAAFFFRKVAATVGEGDSRGEIVEVPPVKFTKINE